MKINLSKNSWVVCIILLVSTTGQSQVFTNASLESWGLEDICEVNSAPDSWQNYSTEGDAFEEANSMLCPSTVPGSASNGNIYGRAYAEDEFSGEGIAQSVSGFIPGDSYLISFDYAGSDLFPGQNEIQWHTFIDDIEVDETPAVSSFESSWTQHSITFTASSAVHLIGFRAFTLDNDGSGSGGIDNFSIVESVNSPVASFTQSESVICVGECVQFTNTSVFTNSIEWSFSGGNPSNSTSETELTVCYNSAGTFLTELTVIGENGLTSSAVQELIVVNNFPTGSLNLSGNTITLNTETNEENITWFLNGIPLESASFMVTPANPGDYNVILTSEPDCQTTLEIEIELDDPIIEFEIEEELENESSELDIWIPNAVTFDNDGLNDIWTVEGNKENWSNYHAMIFDRWGHLIFESYDPYGRWIGNVNGGDHYAPDGIYTYLIKLNNSGSTEVELYSGFISVFR